MQRSRVIVVGAGFAGYYAARILSRQPDLEVVLINPTDYFLYFPLLPEVAAGVLEPRRVCVSLPRQLPEVRLVLGTVDRIDLDGREVGWVGPVSMVGSLRYDRLILTVGSVNRLLPIPGVSERAHGRTGSAALRRRCTCATTSPVSWNSQPLPTIRASVPPGARSWSSGPATPAPRWPLRVN